MTNLELMEVLAIMFNNYDASCWLKRPRKEFNKLSAAEMMRGNENDQVLELLKQHSSYAKVKKRKKRRS